MNKRVIGYFKNKKAAEEAVKQLQKQGVKPEEIILLTKEKYGDLDTLGCTLVTSYDPTDEKLNDDKMKKAWDEGKIILAVDEQEVTPEHLDYLEQHVTEEEMYDNTLLDDDGSTVAMGNTYEDQKVMNRPHDVLAPDPITNVREIPDDQRDGLEPCTMPMESDTTQPLELDEDDNDDDDTDTKEPKKK